MPEYIPLGNKVILKKLPKTEEKQGLILSVSDPKDKFMAEVVSYQPKPLSDPLLYLIPYGSIVRYAPYQAHVIDEDNPDILIIDEEHIWCVVK